MALRPLLLAAVVGIAALGAFHTPAAQARGYVSISVGSPAPYYRGGYDRGYQRASQVWVPAHWVATYRGRVWVPGQYVRVQGYGHGRDRGYGSYGNYGNGGYSGHGNNGVRVIYRSGPNQRVVPRSYYPPGYLSPRGHRSHRGW